MRVPLCGLLIVGVLRAGAAQAQTFNDLQIQLGYSRLFPDGGERPGDVWFSSGPVRIGQPVVSTWSFGNTCEAWGVSSASEVRDDATAAWRIELTPTRVLDRAVTFRMRWFRAAALKSQLEQSFDSVRGAHLPGDDVEITLRPRESFPVDSVRVPAGAKTVDGRPCGSTASIRVSVDDYPSEESEGRLVAADLWLVERLPDGGEKPHGPPLSVRGLPNRPVPFFFDSVADAQVPLDIYGTIAARPDGEAMDVVVETRCHWPSPRGIHGAQRTVRPRLKAKPAETVEIRLPPFDDGPFARRQFSIRLRVRQLR